MSKNLDMFHLRITIDVVKGGFVLEYPVIVTENANAFPILSREVFTSQRKMNQKLKEVLDTLSTTPDDSKGD